MDIIKLLPEHVTNQIAAGEVIQRPASAVKEMLENSLDAGSTHIQLYVKDAGKTLLHVVDNGCGMSKSDAKICFKRHATSKIKNISDLFKVKTMGFRGEAIASIASIAHIELHTKLTEENIGTELIVEAGEFKKEKECLCSNGTSFKVKNLFFNVPARRNFLKSDKVEFRHIHEEFTRLSLSNPEIKMQIFHNENEILHLPISNFRQRIVNILGNKINENLVPINENSSIVNISGFIAKPSACKRTRGEQYFFVNNRFIKNYYLNHAVMKAYEGLLPSNYFPSYFINLAVDSSKIDINIHPTKSEIKFEYEKEIYSILKSTIKKSLGTFNIAPTLDFSQESAFNVNLPKNKAIKQPSIKIDKSYNPFTKQDSSYSIRKEIKIQKDLYEIEEKTSYEGKNIIQIKNEFIVFPSNEGLLLVHQQRAHKRILYEYFIKGIKNQQIQSQKLLFPKMINLNKKDLGILMEIQKKLLLLGFTFKKINAETISINGVPEEFKEINLQLVIEDFIEQFKSTHKINNSKNEKLAKSLSTSLCINKKKSLCQNEMFVLKQQLLKCSQPSICPFGKKTMINIKYSEIKKYF